MATVLITGANRGIGLELARRYAARGDKVIGTARNPASADALRSAGPAVECLSLDVTDAASIAALTRQLAGRPIDILIANSGMMAARGGLDDPGNTHENWAKLLATNVTGPFMTIKALAPNVAAARGRIAVISSRMGSSSRAVGNSYLYRASKAAASNLALNLSADLKSQGVIVASFHPGWVKTDMGGPGAEIDVQESGSGLVRQIDQLTMASTGAFLSYDGTEIDF